MSEVLLSYLFVAFCIMQFEFSFCFSGANRAYYGLLKSIGEASVIAYDEEGENTQPYFLVSDFEDYVKTYLIHNLKKYVTSYQVNFAYDNDGQLPSNEYNIARLTIECKISHWANFKKGNSFHIEAT